MLGREGKRPKKAQTTPKNPIFFLFILVQFGVPWTIRHEFQGTVHLVGVLGGPGNPTRCAKRMSS